MSKLTGSKGPRNSSDKDCLPGVQSLGTIHYEIAVTQVPWANLNLGGGGGGGGEM